MSSLIVFFNKFRKMIGGRIYILFMLAFIVGLVEGLGITLFLPILQSGFGDDKLSQGLKFIFGLFHLGFSFSLLLMFIALIFILRAVFLISYKKFFGRVSANLIIRLRRNILDGIFSAEYLYTLKRDVGYINNIITREIPHVVEAFDTFIYMFSHSIYVLIYITLSLMLNFQLTVIVMFLSPLLIIAMKKLNLRANQISRKTTSSYGKFNSILFQVLSKLKYLKSTFSYSSVSERVNKENTKLGVLVYKLAFLHALSKEAFEPVIVLIVTGLLFYHVVIQHRDVGEVIFLSLLFLQIARQFLNAQSSYRRFISSIGSIEIFNKLDRELQANRENLNPDSAVPDFGSDVSFREVTVIFPNGKKALDSVSITIKPQQAVAFVGHSGSGKSTIANIITGILKPTSGTVLFGSTDYKNLNLKALRENIGYVTQEDIIFNASIRGNISLWSDDMDMARLKKVIELAHITGFVNDLPDKQDSMLGDNGLDISGGQRQRITIARELYKDTKLLILDEATSSLDSKSEKQIYENLKEFRGKKTMVVIAHRLSTIRNADYIYVLDDGKIVEEGTYEELYGRLGEFTSMVNDQKVC